VSVLLAATFVSLVPEAHAGCDAGWDRLDDKCVMVTGLFLNKVDAAVYCASLDSTSGHVPTLLTIKSLQEQILFHDKYFTELGMQNGALLGAVRVNETVFRWDDGSVFVYENWGPGRPTLNLANACVEFAPGNIKSTRAEVNNEDGEWIDVACSKLNIVVCETPTTVTLQELHEMVLEIKSNPVPSGFIYVQLPDKPSPVTLWPSLVWQNVTHEYEGLFFRAAGGASAGFGEVQDESSPRLESIHAEISDEVLPSDITVPSDGSPSPLVFAGYFTDPPARHEGMSFQLSTVENRPRNTAVLIWRRL